MISRSYVILLIFVCFLAAFLASVLSNASNPGMGVDFLSKVCNPQNVTIHGI